MNSLESSSTQQTDSKNQLVQTTNHINTNPDPIDFDECLKDSPKFRQTLKDNLAHVEHLENCMSKTIKQVSHYIDTGRDHIKSQKDLIHSMKTLNVALGASNKEISKSVNTLLGALEEIMRLHEIVIDQSARTVGSSLSKFINDDLVKLKEARKSFDKIGQEHDQALMKYSQPLKRQQEGAENLLIATSTAFTHTSIDLSIQLVTLQSKKNYDILSPLLSFTRAQSTFFHQGFDLFEDLRTHMSSMDEQITKVQDEYESLTRNLPSKHLMVRNNELKPLQFDNKAQEVHLEGYLFKRASNGFKVWNRRWFVLKDHQLMYQKRGDTQPIVMEEDLRLLTVRPVEKVDGDRRFCFEVVSPQKSHILQADSEASCKTWMNAIQAGINAAFHDSDHKTRVHQPGGSEPAPQVTTSSWSSSFSSLKALQQQATSRLTGMTALSGDGGQLEKAAVAPSSSNNLDSLASGDEDDQLDSACRVDNQGRSYAPLRDSDDDARCQNDSKRADCSSKTDNRPNIPAEAAAANSKDPPEKPQRAYMIILAMPGNDTCADCGAQQPRWASINLGITLCIECAGIHRSLGVHLSKVRSLTLDTEVWSPEVVQLMLSLGNSSVNSAYMACYRGQIPQIDSESSRESRENWIKNKYLLKNFMRLPGSDLTDDSIQDESNEAEETVKPELNGNSCGDQPVNGVDNNK